MITEKFTDVRIQNSKNSHLVFTQIFSSLKFFIGHGAICWNLCWHQGWHRVRPVYRVTDIPVYTGDKNTRFHTGGIPVKLPKFRFYTGEIPAGFTGFFNPAGFHRVFESCKIRSNIVSAIPVYKHVEIDIFLTSFAVSKFFDVNLS